MCATTIPKSQEPQLRPSAKEEGSDVSPAEVLVQFTQPHSNDIGVFVRHDSSTEFIEISSGMSEGLNG